jgi:hypothetical protein
MHICIYTYVNIGGIMIHDICEADERNELAEVDSWLPLFMTSFDASNL